MTPLPAQFEPQAAVVVTVATIAPYIIILIGAWIYARSREKDND